MAEGVLSEIVAAKREELRERYSGVTLDALRQQARPTARSLAGAIARRGSRFILEIKRASPSRGAIRAGARFIVSPVFNPAIVDIAHRHDVPAMP